MKKLLTSQTLILFALFFAALAVTEAAGVGPAAVAARIRSHV